MVHSTFPSGSGLKSGTVRRVLQALYALALLFSLPEFIITAVLVSDYERGAYPNNSIRDRLRFLLFTSTWNLVFIPIFLFASLKSLSSLLTSVTSQLGFAFLTWVFWLSGAASWTDALGGNLRCGDIFLMNQTIDISVPYCDALRAVQAFSWMIWITLTGTLACVAAEFGRAERRGGDLNNMRETHA